MTNRKIRRRLAELEGGYTDGGSDAGRGDERTVSIPGDIAAKVRKERDEMRAGERESFSKDVAAAIRDATSPRGD